MQTFDLQFQSGFILHPVSHASLHEEDVNCYTHILVEQDEAPVVNPHANPALSLKKEHVSKEVAVLENPDTKYDEHVEASEQFVSPDL